ncbi:MAG: Ig-like domain-containing protein [Clostridia bacterium]|nr:Ig-like domain-containing protein [Clostridia bacterium]
MKRKILVSLLSIFAVMTGLLLATMCMAEPTATLTITANMSEAHPGDTITYTVTLGPIEDLNVLQIQLDIPEGLSFNELNVNAVKTSVSNALFAPVDCVIFSNDAKLLTVLNCGAKEDNNAKYTSFQNTTILQFTCNVKEETSGNQTVGFIEQDGANVRTKLARSSTAGDVFDLTLNSATVNVTTPPLPPTGVSLDSHELELTEGNTSNLTATIAPQGASGTLVWTSSDDTVASVDSDGVVTAAGVGNAVITVTIDGTEYSDSCDVYVNICEHVNKIETAFKQPTCTQNGNNTYYCCEDCHKYLKADGTTETTIQEETTQAYGHDFVNVAYDSNETQHWQRCTRCQEESEHVDHTFGVASYEWSADKSTCEAKHQCTKCNKWVSEKVNASTSITAATCTKGEKTTYTATFSKPGFTVQFESATTGESLGHAWGEVIPSWSADNSTCTCTRLCTRDGCIAVETETVETSPETTATCTEAGTTTYTATFANEAFEQQSKNVAVDALGHDYKDVIAQVATEEQLGIMQKKCSRCGDINETRQYIAENTSPYLYSDGTFITGNNTVFAGSSQAIEINGKEKNINVILQDPLEIFADHDVQIEIENLSTDLGAEYDGNITIENAYVANILLKVDGVETSGQLPGKTRLLLEIPNDTDDSWNDEDIHVVRITIGDDVSYLGDIEYQVYDSDENFIKIVDKDYFPAEGETVRKFVAAWVDHFSQYAVIDELVEETTSEEETSEGGNSNNNNNNNNSNNNSSVIENSEQETSNGESQNANPENNQNKKSPNTSDSLLETFFLSLLLFTLFGTLLLKTNSKKGNLE